MLRSDGAGDKAMMQWLKRAARLLSPVALLPLAACATMPAGDTETARPALWKLADADTTVYLFGTVHMLPEGLAWRTPAIERAIAEADGLVLETAAGTDLARTGRTMIEMGVSPDLPPLLERVPENKRAGLRAMIESAGLSTRSLDRLETWAAAMSLFATMFRTMGFEGEEGVEQGLSAAFEEAGKPIGGLETVEQQFRFFDALPEETQRAFLISSIEDPAAARANFEALVKAWAAGDVAALARTFDSADAFPPELRQVLMVDRNRAWAEWLDARLERPGTVLVAVGAGHLAGRDSVQAMLEERGLPPERIQ